MDEEQPSEKTVTIRYKEGNEEVYNNIYHTSYMMSGPGLLELYGPGYKDKNYGKDAAYKYYIILKDVKRVMIRDSKNAD